MVMVLVANPTKELVQAGMSLGECEEVELVSQPSETKKAVGICKMKVKGYEQGEESGKKESRVRDHLVDVMEWSGKSLTKDKKEVLAKLLRDNSDHMGCTSLVQHYINTRDTTPIRQFPRRIAPAHRKARVRWQT